MSVLSPDSGGVVTLVKPGANRLIAFVDVDADSNFSAVPDTLLGREIAARTDTVSWYLEPWTMAEGLQVEPGLIADFLMPAWPDTLSGALAPPPLVPPVGLADSLGTVLPDSLTLDSATKQEK